jgi:hypothetical protein
MKIRYKETGETFDVVQWSPGLEHPCVLRENPPTRGEPSGSGTLRGGWRVLPGQWMIVADGDDVVRVTSDDPSTQEYYETVEEGEEREAKKLCPIMQNACVERECAWYKSDDGRCAVFARILD